MLEGMKNLYNTDSEIHINNLLLNQEENSMKADEVLYNITKICSDYFF